MKHKASKIYVTVCKQTVAKNNKAKRPSDIQPAIRVSYGKYGKPQRVASVELPGARLIYDHCNPLPWGARAWLEIDL